MLFGVGLYPELKQQGPSAVALHIRWSCSRHRAFPELKEVISVYSIASSVSFANI